MKKIVLLSLLVLASFGLCAQTAEKPMVKLTAPKANEPVVVKVNGSDSTIDVLTGATKRDNYTINHRKTKVLDFAVSIRINGVSLGDNDVAFLSTKEKGEEDGYPGHRGVSLTKTGYTVLLAASGLKGITVDDLEKTLTAPDRDLQNKKSDSEHGKEMFDFKQNAALSAADANAINFNFGRESAMSTDLYTLDTFKIIPLTEVQKNLKKEITKPLQMLISKDPMLKKAGVDLGPDLMSLSKKNALQLDEMLAKNKDDKMIEQYKNCLVRTFLAAVVSSSALSTKSGKDVKVTQIKDGKEVPAQVSFLDMNKKFHYKLISLEEREKLPNE